MRIFCDKLEAEKEHEERQRRIVALSIPCQTFVKFMLDDFEFTFLFVWSLSLGHHQLIYKSHGLRRPKKLNPVLNAENRE